MTKEPNVRMVWTVAVGVALLSAAPARAQWSDSGSAPESIRASAARLAETVSASQDEGGVVLRTRSQGLAGLGVGLVGVGAMLAVARPGCGYDGDGVKESWFGARYAYQATYTDKGCDVAVVVSKSRSWFVTDDLVNWNPGDRYYERRGNHVEYVSDIKDGQGFFVVPGEVDVIQTTTNNIRRHVGLAVAGAGAFLIWYGLSRVEVPFRVDLTAGQGIGVRASRAFTW